MGLTYCFEADKVEKALSRMKKNDLAVIDTDGIDPQIIRSAVARGVWVYGYLNAGALEKERSYYSAYKPLRIAKYDGWEGEYWVDVTDPAWITHLIDTAREIKLTGAIGVYFDNTDIYYMVSHGFSGNAMRKPPTKEAVYKALAGIVNTIQEEVGLIVMPNGGDDFVKRFIAQFPDTIQTINQEGCFYEDFRAQPKDETAYRKEYMKWAQKHIGGKVRGIEYVKSAAGIAKCKAYYAAHGWDLYISKHKNLEGD